jgi:hypothetical protein
MATSYLPDPDHVVRHISSQLLDRDPATGQVRGCFPHAFELRPGENYLSPYWLEFFDGRRDQRLMQMVAATKKVRTVRPSHGFAVGNVALVKEACASYNMRIRVIHEPDDHPAHTAIRNFRSDEIELLELLASEAWCDVVEAKDYL